MMTLLLHHPGAEEYDTSSLKTVFASAAPVPIELAEAFAQMNPRPKRSMIFLNVSGEEKNLWGSGYFAEHSPVPVENIVANVNIDMVGRNWKDTIVVIGKEHSDLGATLNRVAAAHPELNMRPIDDIWPQENFYFRSDHYNFARKGVPILFFFSGTHADYHRPSDSPDRIDAEKLQVLALRLGEAVDHYRRQTLERLRCLLLLERLRKERSRLIPVGVVQCLVRAAFHRRCVHFDFQRVAQPAGVDLARPAPHHERGRPVAVDQPHGVGFGRLHDVGAIADHHGLAHLQADGGVRIDELARFTVDAGDDRERLLIIDTAGVEEFGQALPAAGRKLELWLTPTMSADLADFDVSELNRRFLFGGLPPFLLADSLPEREYQEWVDGYWAKDIQELFRLERRHSFQRFLELLLAHSGGIFEATRYAEVLEPRHRDVENVEVFLADEIKQEVERPLEGLEHDLERVGRDIQIVRQLDHGLAVDPGHHAHA